MGVVGLATIITIFLHPNSETAFIVARFQTLLTGVFAGLAALVTAGYLYRAAKLSIEAEEIRAEEKKKDMKRAGAAQLIYAVQGICTMVMLEAGKNPDQKIRKLVVPDAYPSLETLSTQDSAVIKELSEFLAHAGKFNMHTVLETWDYNPDITEPDEKMAVLVLTQKGKELQDTLWPIARGN